MPKINTVSTGHGSKVEHYVGGITIQYNVYPQATPKEKGRIDKVKKQFISLINWIEKFI